MKTIVIGALEWQHEDNGTKMTFDAAKKYAASLGKGWRLPTIVELLSIVDYSRCAPACINKLKCRSSGYWSGTTVAPYPRNAWVVDFDCGHTYWDSKDYSWYVRCVRGDHEKG